MVALLLVSMIAFTSCKSIDSRVQQVDNEIDIAEATDLLKTHCRSCHAVGKYKRFIDLNVDDEEWWQALFEADDNGESAAEHIVKSLEWPDEGDFEDDATPQGVEYRFMPPPGSKRDRLKQKPEERLAMIRALRAGPDQMAARVRCQDRSGGASTLVRSSDERVIGRELSTTQCEQVVNGHRVGFVCAYHGGNRGWKATKIATLDPIGRETMHLEDCLQSIAHAQPNVICTNTGVQNHRGRKPTYVHDDAYSDADLRGSSATQQSCHRASSMAKNGYVCTCNGNYCRENSWQARSLATSRPKGSTTTLERCIASL